MATAVVSEPPRPRVVISPEMRVQHALALEPGDDDDATCVLLAQDALRIDAGDAGLAVVAVGCDAGLGARERDGRDSEGVQCHRDEGRALVLAGRQKHVQLAWIGVVGDGAGKGQKLVRGIAHRGDDDDKVRAGGAFTGDRAATRRIRSALATDEPPNF